MLSGRLRRAETEKLLVSCKDLIEVYECESKKRPAGSPAEWLSDFMPQVHKDTFLETSAVGGQEPPCNNEGRS